MPTATKILPQLPGDLVWSIDRHYNPFMGNVCALKIVRRRQRKVLGITFKWWDTFSHSVVPDEEWWVTSELESMASRIRA